MITSGLEANIQAVSIVQSQVDSVAAALPAKTATHAVLLAADHLKAHAAGSTIALRIRLAVVTTLDAARQMSNVAATATDVLQRQQHVVAISCIATRATRVAKTRTEISFAHRVLVVSKRCLWT